MDKHRKKILILLGIVIAALFASGARLYMEDTGINVPADCTIEYGKGECIGGYFKIPFYNPNQQDITMVRITVPNGISTSIKLPADFTVSDPLLPGGNGIMTLFPCGEDVGMNGFSMEWCCGNECSVNGMGRPSGGIKISK